MLGASTGETAIAREGGLKLPTASLMRRWACDELDDVALVAAGSALLPTVPTGNNSIIYKLKAVLRAATCRPASDLMWTGSSMSAQLTMR